MKDNLIEALSLAKTPESTVDRRSFVKLAAAGLGLLAGTSPALATIFRRTFVPIVEQGPPLIQLPPPEVPLARLTFEVSAGVSPHHMLRMLQDYIAQTLTPDWAGQIVQAQALQPVPGTFHQNYWSDYRFQGQIPPTRTRYGYYTGVNDYLRSDGQAAIRPYQDLNYFEMRRVINASEMTQFGAPLTPYSDRRPPSQADMQAFYRVCREYYGIQNPDAFALMYVRQLTNGRNVYNSYLISRGPDPMRSPFKDLLVDNMVA